MKQSARILSWIITAPIALLVVIFAVSNLDRVTLHLWPLPFDITFAVWAWTLIEVFVGFLLGAIVTWIADRPRRRETRLAIRRIGELEQSLAAAKRDLADLERKAGETRSAVLLPAATA